ncbi:MAG: transposase [Bacteroidetes bacterium]|nr:transposase [Bacteroidota bacterium]
MRKAYTSDLTDAQWQLLEPSIPPARTGRRNRTLDMRETVNAMLYLLKNGCSWRDLPGEFLPWPSVNGRKRHLMVEGLPVEVTAANVSDQAGAKLLLSGKKDEWPRLKLLWVDGAYDGVAEWALEEGGWVLEVVHKLAEKGFHVLPRRWVVERTFAWLMKWILALVNGNRELAFWLGGGFVTMLGTGVVLTLAAYLFK